MDQCCLVLSFVCRNICFILTWRFQVRKCKNASPLQDSYPSSSRCFPSTSHFPFRLIQIRLVSVFTDHVRRTREGNVFTFVFWNPQGEGGGGTLTRWPYHPPFIPSWGPGELVPWPGDPTLLPPSTEARYSWGGVGHPPLRPRNVSGRLSF